MITGMNIALNPLYTNMTITNKTAFFTSTDHRGYKLWSCKNLCDALSYLLDNILSDLSDG